MTTFVQSAVIVDTATGAPLRLVCSTKEQLKSTTHATVSETFILLRDANVMDDATVRARITQITGKTPPTPVLRLIVDTSALKVRNVCMVYAGVNDQAPSGTVLVAMPAIMPSGNRDWTKWTYNIGTGTFSAPSPT